VSKVRTPKSGRVEGPTEAARVISWREKQFRELGFAGKTSALLALSKADTHEAAKLLADGCKPEVAALILL
jgi:hypothetical protein